ncbi:MULTISPECIES: hypothetical protein [unclassified Streptomyces]|uniref:hypothetical protein n=1 Tax=Streptomyces TaxID=1883 RepID=UPI0001C1C485|nr:MULTISPECIES: hypothetical protein [unclassified Streptomyces]MYR67458.1 DUF461 domain-containing protein [Streptomyces sp. SID4939]MYS04208.1 DUF461 domain-containing protein [Streptomyces sp. SID4940]MYT61957.1 DUF461 domain-containing protein [Streptomyces sp. SID8357]MYT85327.1 DUF461 domain-containing protein [Streptomyces sp. SID8360]MYU36440.1 DUF461 domain-containing protein [Streptomyces sp. SID8358]MYW38978.1 DUF461 domain-containing protein [Streptomyces sp. SID1]MYX72874.1 DUF
MSRSLRHGAFAATALVFSIASLSACGAGNDAQTLKVRPDNAATAVDNLKIQNVNVITQPDPEAEGPAVVAATLFNDGTKKETLESVTLPGTSATVKLSPAKGDGPVVVPAGGRLVLGGKGNASAVIENGRDAGADGDVRTVAFSFSETGEVSLGAAVVPATHFFKGFGPSALPSAKPTPSPSKSASGTPSGEASESGAESGTPSDDAATTE